MQQAENSQHGVKDTDTLCAHKTGPFGSSYHTIYWGKGPLYSGIWCWHNIKKWKPFSWSECPPATIQGLRLDFWLDVKPWYA